MGFNAATCDSFHCQAGVCPIRQGLGLWFQGQCYCVPEVSDFGGNGLRQLIPNISSWLGQNSKQSKLQRQLGEVQIRMRLKVSGNRAEIRQSYIPALFPRIVLPLMGKDSSAVCDCRDCRSWSSYLDAFFH